MSKKFCQQWNQRLDQSLTQIRLLRTDCLFTTYTLTNTRLEICKHCVDQIVDTHSWPVAKCCYEKKNWPANQGKRRLTKNECSVCQTALKPSHYFHCCIDQICLQLVCAREETKTMRTKLSPCLQTIVHKYSLSWPGKQIRLKLNWTRIWIWHFHAGCN